MIGAIIGDIVGSRFEFNNHRSTEFELFHKDCFFTDDTVCTVAVADWLLNIDQPLSSLMKIWCLKYPHKSYGGGFLRWINSVSDLPYNSFGNGSAMRVSPVGWAFHNLEETSRYAKMSAEITHNHPEGIKGALAVATAIFLARMGNSKRNIRLAIQEQFSYTLLRNMEELRKNAVFDETCQGSVPEAITCFLWSDNFEHAIRLAVSIGGDSDTIAAITGSIAEAYYGIPADLEKKALSYLPDDMIEVITQFKSKFPHEGHDL